VSTNGRKSRDFKIEILSLFLSLSLRKEKGTQKLSLSLFPLSLSLYVFEVSLFRPKKVRFARNRERGYMICSRRFVSLFKKCFSRLTGVGVLKKKSDEFNAFEHKIRVEKKRNISEFTQLSHKNTNCE